MNRYDRQYLLKNIGQAGQKKLAHANILIIGVGGLGSFVASELAKAGVGTITIMDPDKLDLTNLHRQNLYTEADLDTNEYKVFLMRNHLNAANSEVNIIAINQRFNQSTLVNTYNLLIDCTDDFSSKLLINQIAVDNSKPLIYGTCARNQGMVMFSNSAQNTACINCMYSYNAMNEQALSQNIGTDPNIVAITGSLQSSLAIKFLVGHDLDSNLISIDNWNFTFNKIKVKKNPKCSVCGDK